MIGVHVTPALYDIIQAAADAQGLSMASFVRRHIIRIVKRPTAQNKRLAALRQSAP